MSTRVAAALRADRVLAALVAAMAAPVGAVAVVSPAAAVAVVVALGFVAVAVTDLAAGVSLFVVLTFFALIPGIGSSVVSVVKLAGAALVISLGRKKGRPSLLRDHPLVASLAILLVAWTFVSALWAPAPERAHARAFSLTLSVILVFVVYGAIRTARHARWLVRGYVAGAVLSVAAGFVLAAPESGDASRLSGGIGDPNELALLLVPGLALALFALPGAQGLIERSLLGVGALAIAIAVLATGSRGGIVALAVMFGAGILLGGRLRAQMIAAALGVAMLAAAYFTLLAPPAFTGRVVEFTAGGGSGRVDLWTVASQVARDHPIVGTGAANFEVVAPEYASRATNLPAVEFIVVDPHVVHNSYLEVLAELGVTGLVFFLGALAGSLALGWRAVRAFARSGDEGTELIARGLLIALCGMLTASVFLSAEYTKQLWLLLGFAAALTSVARGPVDQPVREAEAAQVVRPVTPLPGASAGR